MRLPSFTPLLAGAFTLLCVFAVAAASPTGPAMAQDSGSDGAFDLAKMTDAERNAFRAEVRRVLLEQPEIIAEALQELERRRTESALAGLEASIADGDFVRQSIPENADLTLIELTDYDCPYCRRAQPEVAEFLKNDPKIGHIIVALPYIGADTAERAALAAKMQADDETIAELHTRMMSVDGRMTEETMRGIADDLGLEWERLMVDMASPTVENQLNRTVEIARALRIEGTPAFVIGGQVLGGLRSAQEFASIVEALRAKSAKN